jgi:hypothetical protein
LIDSRTLLAPGTHAILQYPLLALDDSGNLHLAWTTQKHGVYLYWDIHHMCSLDGGETFQSSENRLLELPVVADDTGPTRRITLDDEFNCHTWLSSSLVRNGYWHGMYLAQLTPPRQHYVRYELKSGKRDIDIQPIWKGESIQLQGLDGFMVADTHDPHVMYAIGNDSGHLACLVSRDEGQSWHDYARSERTFSLYSIGGYRWTTADRSLVGSFTDQVAPDKITDRKSRVYYFRIPAAD